MPPNRPNSLQGVNEKAHWLRSDEPTRSRPWAYEELLFGSSREGAGELGAVVEELENERGELAQLYAELNVHFGRIASLEKRLDELTPATDQDESWLLSSRGSAHARVVADKDDSRAFLAQRSYSLARCEGFEVDSPAGPVGFVEGLRFISRIDQPDLLEVRGGRFGRELLLIPIEQVEDVLVTEERVVVRSAPTLTGDLLAELVDRFRRVLHLHHAAS
jgi:hypothetical protein